MPYDKFKPSVSADLEEWDNTTDAIMWLISKIPDYKLECAELRLETCPQKAWNSHRLETLHSLKAKLEGYESCYVKATFVFNAELTYITVKDRSFKRGWSEAIGYIIEVVKVEESGEEKTVNKHFITGTSSEDFKLVTPYETKPNQKKQEVKA
ncbi:MAG: hypothetical protein ACQCN3_02355 [Candidatus Bathyarchaeia archaeon]|jgi:hypothetical protein